MARFKDASLMKLVGDYLNIYLPHTRESSPNTINSYKTSIALFDQYLKETGGIDESNYVKQQGLRGCDTSCLSTANLLGFLDWLKNARGNSSKTREQRLAAIVGLIDYAVMVDISNASLLVEAQRVRKKLVGKRDAGRIVGHMSEKAWDVLIAQPDVVAKRTEHRNWVFMVLMYETAARNQEVLDLRTKDIVLDSDSGPMVYIKGKGGRHRAIPIRESCVEIMRDYIERFHPGRAKTNDPLFYVRRKGEKAPLSPDASEKFLARYGRSAHEQYAGVPEKVHPHLIRHTRAVHLLEGGMNVEDLSKFLGHKEISTTKVYIQSSAEAKRISMAKASGKDPSLPEKLGFWEGDEDLIRRLENPSL